MSSFTYIRRVEFADTDMAGIMHFSAIFRFMESAEHAFFRSLGYSVTLKDLDSSLGLPRVRAEADFRRPFRFEDEVEIELTVLEKRAKLLRYGFKLRKVGDPERFVAAEGSITAVCVRRNADGKLASHELPAELAGKIDLSSRER